MMSRNAKIVRSLFAALLLFNLLAAACNGQSHADEPAPPTSPIKSLGLTPAQASQLQQAIGAHDYIAAEKLLLAEIDRAPHSPQAARMLAFAGSVYFLNHDYMNAAIAWKKSGAIAPLDPRLQFSLAMAYIRIAKPDWARTVLESLAAASPNEALYPYWLGRLDYDGHEYPKAINHFQHAIELAPQMARAYDNLGLCYYYQNQNNLAVENYKKAIDLDRASPHPSPWPYLNLAITQQFLNQLPDAEANLRQAIHLDPDFAQAHFQLGTVLEDVERPEAAIAELREAARINPDYPEPHMAMARIYHKLGQEPQAREEVQTYRRLHVRSAPPT
jgi:tetratricopeptide (TPR) repeat protein